MYRETAREIKYHAAVQTCVCERVKASTHTKQACLCVCLCIFGRAIVYLSCDSLQTDSIVEGPTHSFTCPLFCDEVMM